jgi:ATP/maltotriose-dependent transcriptional regulator MalT
VAFVDVLLARLATRSGDGREAVPRLEAAMNELREFGMDAYADFAHALLAEAEGLGGAPERALAVAHEQLKVTDRNAPLLERVAGIALARLGFTEAARAELIAALKSARARGAEYDVASTVDALHALGSADADLLRERDQILGRLKIVCLPTPAVA